MQTPIHKVIITGTGRAGTTFLVRLLTELGLDTGFTPDSWRTGYVERCAAGLEHDIRDPVTPYVIKNPNLCETLPAALATVRYKIDHALIPIRDLKSAALSRARIGGRNGNTPGGLWHTSNPNAQPGILAEHFHRLVHTLVEHDIPHTFLLFPRLVADSDYLYERIKILIGSVSKEDFKQAFDRVADPSLVHSFEVPSEARIAGRVKRSLVWANEQAMKFVGAAGLF